MIHKFSVIYAFLRRFMKPGKKLCLLKVSLVFMLIESWIATLNYFFIFFFWSVNYTDMFYILCITFGSIKIHKHCLEYIWYWHVERRYRLSFLSVFAGQEINCMSQVSKFHNFFLTCSETVERFIVESF